MAIIGGFGLLFYLFFGSRYLLGVSREEGDMLCREYMGSYSFIPY